MEIVERDLLVVVGVPVRAAWAELWVQMPKVWRQFLARHQEIPCGVGESFMDVSLQQEGDEYLQLICRQVSKVKRVPPGMTAVIIPRQQYVFHRHVGPVEDIAATFGEMYTWAREQGHWAGSFKLDSGYTLGGDERWHELYVGLLPECGWQELHIDDKG